MTTIKIKTLSTAVAFFVAVAPVTLLSALYLPLIVMLAALIFRGLAFEFRYKSHGLPILGCRLRRWIIPC
jgi:cytochrome bd-type quinol oxidase subunit 2